MIYTNISSIRTMGSFSSTDSIVGKIVVCSDSIIFLRNKEDEEAVLEKIGGSMINRFMNMDQDDDGEKEYLLGEANETIKMVSNLYETNDHNEIAMLELQQQLVDMTTKYQEAMKTIAKQEKQLTAEREGFAIVVNKLNAKLMEKKEDVYTTKEKDNEVCCSTSTMSTVTDTTACTFDSNTLDGEEDVSTWKERYDVLIDKVHELADKNVELEEKCNQLETKNKRVPPTRCVSFDDRLVVESTTIETKYKEALMTIEQLESENETLHQSIGDSIGMSGCMNDMLEYFEKQLVDLDGKLKQTMVLKDETESRLIDMKEENKALKSKIAAEKKVHVTEYDDCYEQEDDQEDDELHTCHISYLLQQSLDGQKNRRYARSKSCLM